MTRNEANNLARDIRARIMAKPWQLSDRLQRWMMRWVLGREDRYRKVSELEEMCGCYVGNIAKCGSYDEIAEVVRKAVLTRVNVWRIQRALLQGDGNVEERAARVQLRLEELLNIFLDKQKLTRNGAKARQAYLAKLDRGVWKELSVEGILMPAASREKVEDKLAEKADKIIKQMDKKKAAKKKERESREFILAVEKVEMWLRRAFRLDDATIAAIEKWIKRNRGGDGEDFKEKFGASLLKIPLAQWADRDLYEQVRSTAVKIPREDITYYLEDTRREDDSFDIDGCYAWFKTRLVDVANKDFSKWHELNCKRYYLNQLEKKRDNAK